MSLSPDKHGLGWLFFSFLGRVTRKEFWTAQFALLFLAIVVFIVFQQNLELSGSDEETGFLVLLLLGALQAIWFFGIAVAVKRAHDLNWPGGTVVLLFLPLFGFAFWFVLGLRRGSQSANNYGPPPN